jgi:hypothetical protein
MRGHRQKRVRVVFVLAALLAVAARPAKVPAAAAAEPRLPGHVVDLVAGDFFFRGPDSIPPGLTTFRLRALQGGHAAWVVRIPPGHTIAELLDVAAAHGPPRWATNLGGPGFPPTGGSANATMVLEPGEYAIVCYVRVETPAGAGAGAGTTAPMPATHVQRGMIRRLVVRATPERPRTPGALPTPAATVRMVDHEFHVSAPLRAGRQVLRVVNAGRAPHEFKLHRVLPGRTGAESLAWTPESGTPPPDEEVATLATLPPGGALTTTVELAAGEYTLFCVPQLARGMKQVVRVLPAAPQRPARAR